MRIRAHECNIVKCSKQTEESFLNKYHYQGYRPSTECYALKYDDRIVEMMTFCIPRYNKSYDWELLRLCTKEGFQVLGGASKLLKAFMSEHSGNIISYCNESKFQGNVYEALGFQKTSVCKSYHYEKDGKSFHRSNFQKRILVNQGFDPNKTEFEIMKERGYDKIEEIQATWTLGEPNDKWYIYRISLDNGCEYIGQHRYHNKIDDGYSGSGKILKAMQKKHKWTMEILVKNISNQKDADRYERCAISSSRMCANNINICDGGHGYIGNGVRGEWDIVDRSELCKEAANKWISKLTDEEKKRVFGSHNLGKEAWNKGKTSSKEQIDKQRESLAKYYETHNGPNKGRKFGREFSDKISRSRIGNRDFEKKLNNAGFLSRSQVFSKFNEATGLSLTQMKRFMKELNIKSPYTKDTPQILIDFYNDK